MSIEDGRAYPPYCALESIQRSALEELKENGENTPFTFPKTYSVQKFALESRQPNSNGSQHDSAVGGSNSPTSSAAAEEFLTLPRTVRQTATLPQQSRRALFDHHRQYMHQRNAEVDETEHIVQRDDLRPNVGPGPSKYVKLKIYYAETHDLATHIDVQIFLVWYDGGQKFDRLLTLRFDQRNLERAPQVDLPAPHGLRVRGDLNFVKLEYNAKVVTCTNAMGSINFGPFSEWAEKLQTFMANGATLHLGLSRRHSLATVFQELNTKLRTETIPFTYQNMYLKDQKDDLEMDNIKDLTPPKAARATVSHFHPYHFLITEMVGLRRERDCELKEIKSEPYTARFIQPHPRLEDEEDEYEDDRLIMFLSPLDRNRGALFIDLDEKDMIIVEIQDPISSIKYKWRSVGQYGLIPRIEGNPGRWILLQRRSTQNPSHALCSTTIAAVQAYPRSILRARSYTVQVTVVPDEFNFRRQSFNLDTAATQLREESLKDYTPLKDLLCCNDFTKLNAFCLLDFEEFVAFCNERGIGLGEGQKHAIQSLECMSGGFGIIQGCAGSGKTYLLAQVTAFLFKKLRDKQVNLSLDESSSSSSSSRNDQTNNEEGGPGGRDLQTLFHTGLSKLAEVAGFCYQKHHDKGTDTQSGELEASSQIAEAGGSVDESEAKGRLGLGVLVATPSNGNARDLEKLFRTELRKIDDSAMIAVKYSRANDEKTFIFQGKLPSRFRESRESIARYVVSLQEENLLTDERVTRAGLYHNVATYLALALGLMEPTPGVHTDSLVARLQEFPEALKYSIIDVINNEHWELNFGQNDDKDHASVHAIRKRMDPAWEWLYSKCDVVVATCQQASDESLYLHFRPSYFIGDEFAATGPADSFCWIHYHKTTKAHILIGDPFQMKPQSEFPWSQNCFAKQRELSFFVRLMLAGFPTVATLREQHRYCSDIAWLISGAFYSLPLSCSKEARTRQSAQGFREAANTIFGKNGNVVLVEVNESREEVRERKTSKHNRKSALEVHHILNNLRAQGYTDNQMGILTSYTEQHTLHEEIYQASGGSGLMIETCGRGIGQQRDIIIYDVTTRTDTSFVSEPSRLCTGLSRARDGLIIVADVQGIRRYDHNSQYLLNQIFAHIERDGMHHPGFPSGSLRASPLMALKPFADDNNSAILHRDWNSKIFN